MNTKSCLKMTSPLLIGQQDVVNMDMSTTHQMANMAVKTGSNNHNLWQAYNEQYVFISYLFTSYPIPIYIKNTIWATLKNILLVNCNVCFTLFYAYEELVSDDTYKPTCSPFFRSMYPRSEQFDSGVQGQSPWLGGRKRSNPEVDGNFIISDWLLWRKFDESYSIRC